MTSETSARLQRGGSIALIAGWVTALLSGAGLIIGLTLVHSLSSDVRSSVSVSQAALAAISQTIEAVDEVTTNTSASLSSATASVESASSTVEGAASAIDGIASFLDEELPETLESVQMSLPAAIQAANAVDGTLRALSLFGVDYNPDEPFGESLSRVNAALASLPDVLRAQSDAMSQLVPSVDRLAGQTDRLAGSMTDLTTSLEGFAALGDDYRSTIDQAEMTIEATSASIDSSMVLIRLLVIGAALGGIAIGIALISIGRTMGELMLVLVEDQRQRAQTLAV
jgi:ABC-type transporter Mla subunit MlaD